MPSFKFAPNHFQVKRQLHLVQESFKAAVYEFDRGVEMLEGYCSLNKLAVLQLANNYEAVAKRDGRVNERCVISLLLPPS